MTVLTDFPHVNQLNSPTIDGQPDENAAFNCVPSSICAGLRYLTGDASFEPDQLKDAAYKQGFTGPTAASQYVDFCAQHGVKLYPINGSPDELVSVAHHQLAQGHPVVFTEPDVHEPNHPDWSHVCVFYADNPGSLTAMDPFGAIDVTHSDAEWAGLLQFNQVWIMEKETMIIDLTDSLVASFFAPTPDGKWQCHQTGYVVQFGMLDFYRSYGQNAYCGLTYLGLPKSNETPIAGHAGVVKQEFERGWLVYDPQHRVDDPPGAGAVYPMHLPAA